MSLTRIILLANSWKHHDFCLAGIEPDTGKWVRPVIANLDDGRIPQGNMHLGGHFPELLDIIEIPLSNTGPDFDFESENRTILRGDWNLVGRATPQDVMKHAQRPRYILHNHKKFCSLEEMQAKAFEKRITLQLIHVRDFKVRDTRKNPTDKPSWKGVLTSGGREIEVGITDPVYFDMLSEGHTPSRNCLLTMSLSLPHAFEGWEGSPPCWKLIAGVIELD